MSEPLGKGKKKSNSTVDTAHNMNMKTAQGTLLQTYFDYRTDNVKMPKSKTPYTGISLNELSTKISRFFYSKEIYVLNKILNRHQFIC